MILIVIVTMIVIINNQTNKQLQITIDRNPWRCDEHLSWFRAGQKSGTVCSNDHVSLSVMAWAICAEPPRLKRKHLRFLGKKYRMKLVKDWFGKTGQTHHQGHS